MLRAATLLACASASVACTTHLHGFAEPIVGWVDKSDSPEELLVKHFDDPLFSTAESCAEACAVTHSAVCTAFQFLLGSKKTCELFRAGNETLAPLLSLDTWWIVPRARWVGRCTCTSTRPVATCST